MKNYKQSKIYKEYYKYYVNFSSYTARSEISYYAEMMSVLAMIDILKERNAKSGIVIRPLPS